MSEKNNKKQPIYVPIWIPEFFLRSLEKESLKRTDTITNLLIIAWGRYLSGEVNVQLETSLKKISFPKRTSEDE